MPSCVCTCCSEMKSAVQAHGYRFGDIPNVHQLRADVWRTLAVARPAQVVAWLPVTAARAPPPPEPALPWGFRKMWLNGHSTEKTGLTKRPDGVDDKQESILSDEEAGVDATRPQDVDGQHEEWMLPSWPPRPGMEPRPDPTAPGVWLVPYCMRVEHSGENCTVHTNGAGDDIIMMCNDCIHALECGRILEAALARYDGGDVPEINQDGQRLEWPTVLEANILGLGHVQQQIYRLKVKNRPSDLQPITVTMHGIAVANPSLDHAAAVVAAGQFLEFGEDGAPLREERVMDKWRRVQNNPYTSQALLNAVKLAFMDILFGFKPGDKRQSNPDCFCGTVEMKSAVQAHGYRFGDIPNVHQLRADVWRTLAVARPAQVVAWLPVTAARAPPPPEPALPWGFRKMWLNGHSTEKTGLTKRPDGVDDKQESILSDEEAGVDATRPQDVDGQHEEWMLPSWPPRPGMEPRPDPTAPGVWLVPYCMRVEHSGENCTVHTNGAGDDIIMMCNDCIHALESIHAPQPDGSMPAPAYDFAIVARGKPCGTGGEATDTFTPKVCLERCTQHLVAGVVGSCTHKHTDTCKRFGCAGVDGDCGMAYPRHIRCEFKWVGDSGLFVLPRYGPNIVPHCPAVTMVLGCNNIFTLACELDRQYIATVEEQLVLPVPMCDPEVLEDILVQAEVVAHRTTHYATKYVAKATSQSQVTWLNRTIMISRHFLDTAAAGGGDPAAAHEDRCKGIGNLISAANRTTASLTIGMAMASFKLAGHDPVNAAFTADLHVKLQGTDLTIASLENVRKIVTTR
ncbi:hypothetical protein VOLCADRAFT_100527 [Volvox carteri f. nagariensis]|uniref:Uncharacterized protein n=1 Tax=Volvox carteri f. nagariensis TaxID=3068 RepID=D8UKE6_VOLCA|nr:uncharacterized protein VOLCADRAFT_100527 [Volvox carteri f. nagariensis]EFJ39800.1 hypothetical protein VOLCADRAFT_100527 [Volvox carteri f. nagariensis]|eukprot:XP_002959136.1 hypothetical protein VOLCADRAFT_100527 [Volvox carteri f. nagariensis]